MDVYFEGLQEQTKSDLRPKYRLLFLTEIGREVLADILVTLCHFGLYLDPEDKAQIGQYNVGVSILSRIGIFSTAVEAREMVNALLNVPIRQE